MSGSAQWFFRVHTDEGVNVCDCQCAKGIPFSTPGEKRSKWLDLRESCSEARSGLRRVELVRLDSDGEMAVRLPAAQGYYHIKKVSCILEGGAKPRFSYGLGFSVGDGAVILWGEADGSVSVEHREKSLQLAMTFIAGKSA